MNLTSYASPEFWALYDTLPQKVQEQARKQYELFARNPFHPSLRLKPVASFWSVRISRSYRALAARRGDQFFWFWVGHHSDYEKLLSRLWPAFSPHHPYIETFQRPVAQQAAA